MSDANLLDVRGICKQFPGVRALDGVDLRVRAGEVHAMLGENGAGKSTLLKILSGALRATRGEATFDGVTLEAKETPRDRQRLGLVTIYQEFNLLPFMSIAENLYLGQEPRRYGIIDWPAMHENARALLASLGLNVDPRRDVRHLSVAHQQMVEIGRAVARSAKLIIMDEPTAALGPQETAQVGDLIRQLKREGIGIFLISHDIHDVFDLADRLAVMKNGRLVGTAKTTDVTQDEVLGMIILGRCPPGAIPGPGAMASAA